LQGLGVESPSLVVVERRDARVQLGHLRPEALEDVQSVHPQRAGVEVDPEQREQILRRLYSPELVR
jgi:hypothetical protein